MFISFKGTGESWKCLWCSVVVKNIASEIRLTLVQILALPFTNCITLGKSHILSEYPYLLKQKPKCGLPFRSVMSITEIMQVMDSIVSTVEHYRTHSNECQLLHSIQGIGNKG